MSKATKQELLDIIHEALKNHMVSIATKALEMVGQLGDEGKKPNPVRKLTIEHTDKNLYSIHFCCVSDDPLLGIGEFGQLITNGFRRYSLYINRCYDFDEVLQYILSNGGAYAT